MQVILILILSQYDFAEILEKPLLVPSHFRMISMQPNVGLMMANQKLANLLIVGSVLYVVLMFQTVRAKYVCYEFRLKSNILTEDGLDKRSITNSFTAFAAV